eukprot:360618-Chlamydomonas_euryale.AAC.10
MQRSRSVGCGGGTAAALRGRRPLAAPCGAPSTPRSPRRARPGASPRVCRASTLRIAPTAAPRPVASPARQCSRCAPLPAGLPPGMPPGPHPHGRPPAAGGPAGARSPTGRGRRRLGTRRG